MRGTKSKSPPQRPPDAPGRARTGAKEKRQTEAAANKQGAGARSGKRSGTEQNAANDCSSEGNHGSDYSVNALSKLLGYDRRTIDKALVGIEPTRTEGKTKYYRIADVENAIRAKKSDKLRDQKLLQEIRKLRIANDKEEGLVVEKTKVKDSIQRCFSPMVATIEQRLTNEYPTAVAGLDVPQARIYGRRLADELIAFLQSFQKEWAI